MAERDPPPEAPQPLERPLRVACVGAGYFAAFQHAAWRAIPGARIAAIVDRDLDRAQAAREGSERAYASLREALDAEAADLVDIATPPDTHLDLIDEATAAGCAVICQKPFCGGLDGAERAVRMADARGVPLVVHENFRFQPWWRRLRAEIEAGRLGEILQVSFRLRPGDGQGPRAYLDRQPYFQGMRRFLVHETAVHFVDVFRFLLGEPDWVWADLRRLNPAIAGEDAGLIVLGYADGRRAVFDGNRLADHPARNPRLVMGEGLAEGVRGSIAIDGDGGMGFRAHGEMARAPIALRFDPARFGGGCVEALQAHVAAVLSSAPHGVDGFENAGRAYLRNLRIVEAIYASNEAGTRVDVTSGPAGSP